MSTMKSFVLRATAVLGLVAAAAIMSPATGSAAPQFAAQARAAGLSTAQAQELQHRVDADLAKVGGTQVAINEIDLDGTGRLLLPLPGENVARDLDSPIQAAATCYFGDFCAWSGTSRTGSFLSKYVCTKFDIPWTTTGSWFNNQTSGTRARFYSSSGTLIYTTPGATSSDNSYNWLPVFEILPC